MRLTSVEIRDYRSIFVDEAGTSLRLELAAGANTLVGQNNCGKSNVLRAISLALDPQQEFSADRDTPGPRPFSNPIITLVFQGDPTDIDHAAVLEAAAAYERSVDPNVAETRADQGEVALQVAFVPEEHGIRRDERLLTTTDVRQSNEEEQQELLALALDRLRTAVRFVLISSGESIESVLEGNFREILHSVVRDRLHHEFETAERSRTDYVSGLQDSLLRPLRDQLTVDVKNLFPEIEQIRLIPEVSSIERTLSNVGVNLEDLVATPLAEKGTGVRGGVLVAMLSYLALNATRGMVFAVEEPEAFLHPAAQELLRGQLEALAAATGVTLLVTTHSPFIVTKSPKGRVFCLAKDRDGRTRVSESAQGDADHAPLIGGLLHEITLESLLASTSVLPPGAETLVLVEGEGDRFCLELAADVVGRPDLLDGMVFQPTNGTIAMIGRAVIAKATVELPLLVVVDNDDAGRKAKDQLVGSTFGFQKKQVITYAAVFPANWEQFPIEAEDLFEPALIAGFAEVHGTSVVDGTKKRPDDAYHYDFGPAAKELLTAYLQTETQPSDVRRWLELIFELRTRAGLDVPNTTVDELIESAPARTHHAVAAESGLVLVVSGVHDHARYLDTGAIVLPADYQVPEGITRIGFYNKAIMPHLPAIVADHPNLLFATSTVEQLRSTGKPGDDAVASVIEAMLVRDDQLAGQAHRVLLLSSPSDEATFVLKDAIKNTKQMSNRPVAWTVGPKVVPVEAFAESPATTDELDEAIRQLEAT
jgi:putative ATP-dependent endonuclease of the OLD family